MPCQVILLCLYKSHYLYHFKSVKNYFLLNKDQVLNHFFQLHFSLQLNKSLQEVVISSSYLTRGYPEIFFFLLFFMFYDLFNKNLPHEIIFWLFQCTTYHMYNALTRNPSVVKRGFNVLGLGLSYH